MNTVSLDGGQPIMILIPLSGGSPLPHKISYSVSPLYELAASLHALAQETPDPRLADWAADVLAGFRAARISSDWEYFRPMFTRAIPDSFDPVQTRGVMAVDDQYNYFFTLSEEAFVDNLRPMLDAWETRCEDVPLAADLREDPAFVKGRFNLFLSTYWQLFFASQWEALAPRFVREAERIHLSLRSLDEITSYLRIIDPRFRYDDEQEQLVWENGDPGAQPVQQLVLSPSHFYTAAASLIKKGETAHLLYRFEQ
ncbi:DUF5937 family protein [Brevibacillus sp. NL20B1]|uniref:DUF5937 family protein n=1 Tax=Brevibacillus sp. NL20B1 TaxID=2829799 RepID=UPI002012886F|nr:DUF5937 family protein [Brevibacillus sp. NL20B1]